MKTIVSIFIFYFLFTIKAFAYLDPGTGSIILQGIIGFLAFASLWWKRIIYKIKSLFKKEKKIEK